MQINREGIFKAHTIERGVAHTGPNELVTFTARYALVQELLDGQWCDIEEEGAEITGYHYLQKRDSSVNENTVRQLREAFSDWNGQDVFWLEEADIDGVLVQLTIGMETYDNKTRPKVKWINNEDAEPTQGVRRSNAAQRTAIKNAFNSKLRATSGGVSRSTPAPKASKPPAPKAPPAAATAPTASNMDEAWGVWCKAAQWPDDKHCEREWFRVLGEIYPDRELESLTADEWQHFVEVGPKKIIPF